MSNFGYVNARLRGQHSRLLTTKDYEELLALPDLDALARWLENSQYAYHWQLAKTRRQGLEAVEEALESNFSATANKILSMAEGRARDLLEVVLRRWELQNLLVLVRGLHQGWTPEEMGRWLWPAGRYDAPKLAELARQSDIKQLADTLTTWRDGFAPPLAAAALEYQKDRDLEKLELALLRFYYGWAQRDLRGPGTGRGRLRSLLRQEIDMHNAKAASRLLTQQSPSQEKALEYFIEGGEALDRRAYLDLFDPRARRRSLSQLRRSPFRPLLSPSSEASGVESELDRKNSERLANLYRQGDPLSVDLAVGYLWQKYYEVANLRLLARAKVFGPNSEKLRPELHILN